MKLEKSKITIKCDILIRISILKKMFKKSKNTDILNAKAQVAT
jgi:hypothetical protein